MSLNLTTSWVALGGLAAFGAAYAAAVAEERLHVRKSVPMLVAAGLLWVLVGISYAAAGQSPLAADAARHTLLDFAELLLFLVPAMTFVNTLEERGLFDALRAWLIQRNLSLRAIFWVTGALAFVISPMADNLTTALLVGGVVIAIGRGNSPFTTLACVNIVVAANAGGAFSPFGDITTLMVWQAGQIPFLGFFALVLPALVNWLVPASALSMFGVRGQPARAGPQAATLEPGAVTVLLLFLGTIVLTVAVHTFLDLPPALGMMAGLGVLKAYSYVFNLHRARAEPLADELDDVFASPELAVPAHDARPASDLATGTTAVLSPARTVAAQRPVTVVAAPRPLDVFALLEKIEWDTLLFFYGVLLCVGALGAFGYLALAAQTVYGGPDPTLANVAIGLLSAFVDNVPVMFAVLNMQPSMSEGQWLLVTLTTGVGGSLLSIGSAAGVALMGQARGIYTFAAHLRWSWAIALGYAASIAVHLLVNKGLFA